jgi:uncharacterized protein (TIGR02147 family)
MNIYEHTDYKIYFNQWIESLPKKGRGEYRRLAEKLNISTTMVSQVFRGEKHLNLELACEISDYLGLSELETEYFFLMVEFARAGSHKLTQKLKKRMNLLQTEGKKLEVRLKKDIEMSEETKSIFYSSWLYSGVQMLTAIDHMNDSQTIADALQVKRSDVQKVLQFLIKEELVVLKNQKLDAGPRRTHVGVDSPLVSKHHQNWRLQGFQKMPFNNPDDLFYTGPMSVSTEVAEKIRVELPAMIEKINKWVMPSTSEIVRCLNIDWFEF